MSIFAKSLLAVGLVGLGSVVASPAQAGDCCGAYISGSSAIVLMNGASQSVGAELSLPSGTYFTGAGATGDVTVTPLLTVQADGTNTTGLAINGNDFTSLNVNAGLPSSVTALSPTNSVSFTSAAAAALDLASSVSADTAAGAGFYNSLEAVVSIIRAGAGINGLD